MIYQEYFSSSLCLYCKDGYQRCREFNGLGTERRSLCSAFLRFGVDFDRFQDISLNSEKGHRKNLVLPLVAADFCNALLHLPRLNFLNFDQTTILPIANPMSSITKGYITVSIVSAINELFYSGGANSCICIVVTMFYLAFMVGN